MTLTSGLMVLGNDPERLVVRLTDGSDFRLDLVLRGVNYPSGASLSLVFDGGTTWDATISADTATFAEAYTVADTIPNKTPVKLVYTESGSTQVWADGEVLR